MDKIEFQYTMARAECCLEISRLPLRLIKKKVRRTFVDPKRREVEDFLESAGLGDNATFFDRFGRQVNITRVV